MGKRVCHGNCGPNLQTAGHLGTVLGSLHVCVLGGGVVEEKGMKSVFTHRYLYALLPKCSNTFCHLSSVLQLSLEIGFLLSRCSWRNEGMEWPRKRTYTVINVSCINFLQAIVLLAILVGSVLAGPTIVRHKLQPISFGKQVRDPSLDLCSLCVQFSQEFLNELVNITARKTVNTNHIK